MELYEIIRSEVLEYHGHLCYIAKTSVVTSTMDKDMAEKMLEIYKYNQNGNEFYEIRTLRMSGKIVEL